MDLQRHLTGQGETIGLRPAKLDEDASGRCRGINDFRRVFHRAEAQPLPVRRVNREAISARACPFAARVRRRVALRFAARREWPSVVSHRYRRHRGAADRYTFERYQSSFSPSCTVRISVRVERILLKLGLETLPSGSPQFG